MDDFPAVHGTGFDPSLARDRGPRAPADALFRRGMRVWGRSRDLRRSFGTSPRHATPGGLLTRGSVPGRDARVSCSSPSQGQLLRSPGRASRARLSGAPRKFDARRPDRWEDQFRALGLLRLRSGRDPGPVTLGSLTPPAHGRTIPTPTLSEPDRSRGARRLVVGPGAACVPCPAIAARRTWSRTGNSPRTRRYHSSLEPALRPALSEGLPIAAGTRMDAHDAPRRLRDVSTRDSTLVTPRSCPPSAPIRTRSLSQPLSHSIDFQAQSARRDTPRPNANAPRVPHA